MCIYHLLAANIAAVFFNQSAYSFIEDSRLAQAILVLSNPLLTDVTIEVIDHEGTAIGMQLHTNMYVHLQHIVIVIGGGHDYTFEPFSITFTAGVTIATINVTIIDNSICDNNKTFTLAINPYAYSLLTSNVIIGDPSDATVTILDDGKCNNMNVCKLDRRVSIDV